MNLVNPYQGMRGDWYRGNLHTHTTESDGRLSPKDVVALYAAQGYDFLSLSDHDLCTPCFDHDQVLLIPGDEVSRGGPHLLAIGVDKVYDTNRTRAEIIAEIVADGGLCVLNHPNWGPDFSHWDQAALEALGPYHGIEIFNSVIDFLHGESHATDRWDRLLSKGRRLWGYANDDLHDRPHGGRGWNMVKAPERTAPALLDSLKAGRFYASTGVTITDINLRGTMLQVLTENADEIRFISRHGIVQRIARGPAGQYDFTGEEGYLRVECWGAGRTAAWTQPIWVEKD